MPVLYESEGPPPTVAKLAIRGACLLAVIAVLLTVMIAKATGTFQPTVPVVAQMADIGDGLSVNADVKFRGVVVGTVSDVAVTSAGAATDVHIDLVPSYAGGIPATVTARVVPSNVFAVPSIQLVDNGPAGAVSDGSTIAEDRSLETVRLQSTLTRAREIVAAAGRDAGDSAVGMLETLRRATAGRGSDIAEAGAQLDRIVGEYAALTEPGEGPSTLESMSTAISALRDSSPELLDALNKSVLPLQTVAKQRDQLHAFLFGAQNTLGTVATAMNNNTDRLITITTNMSAPLGVLADGSKNFPQMVTSLRKTQDSFRTFWNPETQSATAKVVVSLTPHHQYTRADCQRYGELEAPSCTTGPLDQPPVQLPPGLSPQMLDVPDSLRAPVGGNVGPVGSPAEQQQIADILGGLPNAASDILFGALARGNQVQVAPEGGTP